jgi:hypothetical protein
LRAAALIAALLVGTVLVLWSRSGPSVAPAGPPAGPVGAAAPETPERDAAFLGQSAPEQMTPGGAYTVSIAFRNTGRMPWSRGNHVYLGSQNPSNNATWLMHGRVPMVPGETVEPGGEKTFTFTVVAPAEPGTYDLQWQVLQEGVAWFGDLSPNVRVAVVSDGPEAEVVDTLDYFLTKHPSVTLTGSHDMSHVSRGTDHYTIKWSSEAFELHTWDEEHIYLREDHSGAPADFYTFSQGLWMRRHMRVGETLQSAANELQWYDRQCRPTRTAKHAFQTTLEARLPELDVGGDLGVQDVIVLRYAFPGGTGYEKFYYSREWGWIIWEQYLADGSLLRRSELNRISDKPPVEPGLPCAPSAGR